MLACIAYVGKEAMKCLHHFRHTCRTRVHRFNRVDRARGKGGCMQEVVWKHDSKLSCVWSFRNVFRNPMCQKGVRGGWGSQQLDSPLLSENAVMFSVWPPFRFRKFWNTCTMDQRLIQVELSYNIFQQVSSCLVSQTIMSQQR